MKWSTILVFVLIAAGVFFPDKVEKVVQRVRDGIGGPPAVVHSAIDPPPAPYLDAATRAIPAFAKNKQKSQAFRGYFEAIAREVRESEYLETTADLEQLMERASDRFSEVLNIPSVGGGGDVSAAINEIIGLALPREITPLTDTLRSKASTAFLALEWVVQEAAKGE